MAEYGIFFPPPPEPKEPPKPKSPIRIASTRPYSQPRHPNWTGHAITKLERRIVNSGKFYHEIATEAGINPSLLSQIAHGKKGASADVLLRLSLYFKCDPKELVGYE